MPPQPAWYLVVFAGSHISTEVHQPGGIHKDHFKRLVEVIQDRLEEQTQTLVPRRSTDTGTPPPRCRPDSL